MARRRKSTVADLIDLIAMLPWWVDVVLAVLSYLILHRYIVTPLPAAASGGWIRLPPLKLTGPLRAQGGMYCPCFVSSVRLHRHCIVTSERSCCTLRQRTRPLLH